MKRIVLPDPNLPHEIAEAPKCLGREVPVIVWCGVPDRHLVKCDVSAAPGWWLASPAVVDPP